MRAKDMHKLVGKVIVMSYRCADDPQAEGQCRPAIAIEGKFYLSKIVGSGRTTAARFTARAVVIVL